MVIEWIDWLNDCSVHHHSNQIRPMSWLINRTNNWDRTNCLPLGDWLFIRCSIERLIDWLDCSLGQLNVWWVGQLLCWKIAQLVRFNEIERSAGSLDQWCYTEWLVDTLIDDQLIDWSPVCQDDSCSLDRTALFCFMGCHRQMLRVLLLFIFFVLTFVGRPWKTVRPRGRD